MKVEIVPQIVLAHGLFCSGSDGLGTVMFSVEKSARTGQPELLPIHETVSGKRKEWKRISIDSATTQKFLEGVPPARSATPLRTLCEYLNHHPPAWRNTPQRACQVQVTP